MSWEFWPLTTTLFIALLSLSWLSRRQSSYLRVLSAVIALLAIVFYGRASLLPIYDSAHEAVVNATPVERFNMLLFVVACLWLFRRALQTLLKPVPELIGILGVEIPEAPDVCLAGIRSDAATLTWTRPASHRPVHKYIIQVNSVNVGETPGNDDAITVTGLKPSHFYNIRVVAVGHNNFRSGSPVIRLQTFGKDGRPQLGNSRLPASFVDPDQPRTDNADGSDESDEQRPSVPTVEAASVLDGAVGGSRDISSSTSNQRRNTVNRRHSPSVASADQALAKIPPSNEPELSLTELNEKFESIRKEIDDISRTAIKEQAEFVQQEEELKRERDRKRQIWKEKEEQTAQLRALVRTTGEQMRAAEKERAKKEQQLKEKETKKSKIRDSIAKIERDVENMRKEREGFAAQKQELKERRDHAVKELDKFNSDLQQQCAELEAQLKDKSKHLQDLKATRENLPGANDEKWKEEHFAEQRQWETRRGELHARLVAEMKLGHQLDQRIRALSDQVAIMQQHQADFNFYNPPHAPGLDFEASAAVQAGKRLSFPGNALEGTPMSSPPLAHADLNYASNIGFSQAGFGPSLFMDIPAAHGHDAQSEAELKAAGGPLSPSAKTLLPSNIFDDAEDSEEPRGLRGSILPEPITADDDGPQSPLSPARSFNQFSSPHGSTHHLPFGPAEAMEGSSLNANQSPIAPTPPPSSHRLTNLLSTFHRGSRASKSPGEDGVPMGSLKSGQSQSYPRGGTEEEPSTKATDLQRKYFGWMNRDSAEPESSLGNTNFFGRRVNSLKGPRISVISDGERRHSRPPSIASIELPRPSTDSGSIWGTPGDVSGLKNRVWSPPSDNLWPSRSGSRRPSLHGSSTALTTTLASADDEILDEDDLLDPQTSPSQVGVIGSRPPVSSKLVNQRLNPTAPTFMANIFRKDKDKDKDRAKDKTRDGKGKGKDVTTPSIEGPAGHDDSPSDSRVSKDTSSVHTGTSVSESRESLQLDPTLSNTPSDLNSVATSSNVKDSDNVVRKLFRKGSSSKFSLSSRLGKESGLFKKGPGSTTTSDRNPSAEQRRSIGDADDLGEDGTPFGRSYDSMASSPSLGPSKSKDSSQGRMASWRFSMRRKSKDATLKEKESLEMTQSPED